MFIFVFNNLFRQEIFLPLDELVFLIFASDEPWKNSKCSKAPRKTVFSWKRHRSLLRYFAGRSSSKIL